MLHNLSPLISTTLPHQQALARGWPVRELPKLATAFSYQPQPRDAHAEQKHLWHEDQRRARLYDQLGIKKIDRVSGIEWHGCNKVGGPSRVDGDMPCSGLRYISPLPDLDMPSFHSKSQHTPRCFGTVTDDAPEYLYRGAPHGGPCILSTRVSSLAAATFLLPISSPLGRWTPPCCQEHIRETIRYAFSR
jgi:hypothetical protein